MRREPETVFARCFYMPDRQRLFGIPFRRYIAMEIVGHGWTQALRKKDIAYMALDYMCSRYKQRPGNYRVVIEWV